ncbi:hypothetical protein DUI87_08252 [Hirundo rustica rustica]|uniref:Uncharacterized protein n=1 Tax=Hirundo rustica rustica TaxID=333673 RepID=A0A3M0KSG3_HIRRU|nr:hypothetical protein DUI87_08252 [Hirundo rustica rustica]
MQTPLNPVLVSVPDCNAGIKSCISSVRVPYVTMQSVRASGSCNLLHVGVTGRFALLSLSFGGMFRYFSEYKKKANRGSKVQLLGHLHILSATQDQTLGSCQVKLLQLLRELEEFRPEN